MIFIVLGICFLLYLPVLNSKFVVDDLAILDDCETKGIKKPKNKFRLWYMLYFSKGCWDDESKAFHFIPLLTHFATSLLIYYAFGQTAIAFGASILFALHPGNSENSMMMASKAYTRTTFFVLLAWMIPSISGLYLIRPIAFISASFSPFMYLLKPGFEWLAFLGLIKVAMTIREAFNLKLNGKIGGYKNNKYGRGVRCIKLIIMIKFYGYYLFNSVFSIKNSYYQSYMDAFADTKEGIKKGKKLDIFFFIGLAGFITLGVFLRPGCNMAIFGLAWATINILMWCNLVSTGQQYIANRYHYLPNVGICLMIAGMFQFMPGVVWLFAGWYAREIIYTTIGYKDPFWQFEHGIINEPKYYYSWLHKGNLSYHRGNFKAAIMEYLISLHYREGNFKVLFNLSSAFLARGEIKSSIEYFEKARRVDCYGQEKMREEVVVERMKLINYIVREKGDVQLSTKDIPVFA